MAMVGSLDDVVTAMANCRRTGDIQETMDVFVRSLGFAAMGYLDTRYDPGSARHRLLPFFFTTARADFISHYAEDRLFECDPVVLAGRTANLPFSWKSVTPPRGRSQSALAGRRVMDIARDYGYSNGLVIPVHGVDRLGRPTSAVTTLFWGEKEEDFGQSIAQAGSLLHLACVYANDRVAQLRGVEGEAEDCEPLTPRERDCLCWTSRGKTACEIATIIAISENTVNFHLKNAMRKLGVHTKTHAVTRAISMRQISP